VTFIPSQWALPAQKYACPAVRVIAGEGVKAVPAERRIKDPVDVCASPENVLLTEVSPRSTITRFAVDMFVGRNIAASVRLDGGAGKPHCQNLFSPTAVSATVTTDGPMAPSIVKPSARGLAEGRVPVIKLRKLLF
jgi:hypothetical protein